MTMTLVVPPEMKRLEPFEQSLREAGRSYPEVTEDFPWGHPTLKVKGKAFVFFSLSAEGLSLSVKLPQSHGAALMLPFAEPTGYGLGKSGWVTARFGAKDTPPVEMLRRWLDESYRAVAPKKLVERLTGEPAKKEPATKTAAKKSGAAPKAPVQKAPVKKAAAKKSVAAPKAPVKKAPVKKAPARKTAGKR